MAKHKRQEAGFDVQAQVRDALAKAFKEAEGDFAAQTHPQYPSMSERYKNAIEELNKFASKAQTGFTNIVTCLAIKCAKPGADIRYHQVQIQNQTNRPAGFNFRGVSEKVVYPWLNEHNFDGAKSGWQTRTFERPKPYMLSYDENIGDIKEAFLACFDEVEERSQSAESGLAYLIYLQMIERERKHIPLSIPKTKDISLIVDVLKRHFFNKYRASKGASRLPVLALYSVYAVMVKELDRFSGKTLMVLQEHSAADAQTGAVGDIEVMDDSTGEIFEALEVKHDIEISEAILQDVQKKIMPKTIDRYYVLTTHQKCEPNDDLVSTINKIKALYNCQVIVNGVIPSLRYYLRMLSDPSEIFPIYVNLLESDKSIVHEHREIWNRIAIEP